MGPSHTPSLLCTIDNQDMILLWDSSLLNGNSATLQSLTTTAGAMTLITSLNGD